MTMTMDEEDLVLQNLYKANKLKQKRIKELEADIERLREGIEIYIHIKNKQQFSKPEFIKRASVFTGVEYKHGHLISSIVRDLDKALKDKDVSNTDK